MIVKSLSRTTGGSSTGQLINYLLRYTLDKEKLKKMPAHQKPIVIRHNIRSRSIKGYTKEFQRNHDNRIYKRKDAVQVHHTILSFSNLDKAHINEQLIRDVAGKYIELRGTDSLYVITAHYEDHIHLHVAQSGTKLDGLASRISRTEFANIKVALDDYQRQKYPQLIHSLPQHGKAKEKGAREQYKNIKRNERSLDKTSLLQLLDEIYSKAKSQEQFLDDLRKQGMEPYYRAGKLTGVKYNGERKFRLNRLGFDEKKLQALEVKAKEEKQLAELDELRGRKDRTPERRIDLDTKQKPEPVAAIAYPRQQTIYDELDQLRASASQEQDRDTYDHHFDSAGQDDSPPQESENDAAPPPDDNDDMGDDDSDDPPGA